MTTQKNSQIKKTATAVKQLQTKTPQRSHIQRDIITKLALASNRKDFGTTMLKQGYTKNSISWYWSNYNTQEHKDKEREKAVIIKEKTTAKTTIPKT